MSLWAVTSSVGCNQLESVVQCLSSLYLCRAFYKLILTENHSYGNYFIISRGHMGCSNMCCFLCEARDATRACEKGERVLGERPGTVQCQPLCRVWS